MPAYLVTLPSPDAAPSRTLFNGADSVVCFATDVADARATAKSAFDGDGNALWDIATVTAIAAGANLIGYTYDFILREPDGDISAHIVQPCTGSAQDTVDEVGALLVIAFNALSNIANAAYNSTTNVLTVAGTGDVLGDYKVEAFVYRTDDPEKIAIPGFIGTITDEGSGSAALTVALSVDAVVVPAITAKVRAYF